MINHFYHTLHGWSDYLIKAYDYVLDNSSQLEKFEAVEVGCWLGRSLSYLCVELDNRGFEFHINAVDLWLYCKNSQDKPFNNPFSKVRVTYNPILPHHRHFTRDFIRDNCLKGHRFATNLKISKVKVEFMDLYTEFQRNIFSIRDKITVIRKDSILAATLFEDESLDLICLDSCHDFDHVSKEIEAWLPKLKTEGWLIGDDHIPLAHPDVVRAVNNRFAEYMVINKEGFIFKDDLKNRKGAWIVRKSQNQV
jgi:hypothetical protein